VRRSLTVIGMQYRRLIEGVIGNALLKFQSGNISLFLEAVPESGPVPRDGVATKWFERVVLCW
jgi:hypothetical protein